MSSEIYWLTLTVIYSTLLFIPYAIYRISNIGLVKLLMDPLPGDDPFDAKWAHRSYRAHMNALENLVPFAAVVLAVEIAGAGNEVTALAVQVYFWARIIHAPFYIVKTPVVRTLAYFIGLAATLTIAFQLVA